jgi:hypothetical protein
MNRYIKWLKAHVPDISVHQIIPTLVAPSVTQEFHDDLRIYLRGHGITQYRVVRVDSSLNFDLQIHTGF